ncbi:MAG: DUF4058 family protein [Anaerolineae bacterium]|nr:DUF4058 family protein [Anaerolineae bacterium]
MPVHVIKNQYRGINAHLHSIWQGMGGWSRFHTNHITDLLRVMRPLLLPLGYDAELEPSLQIRRIDDAEPAWYPQSDVTIYDLDPGRSAQGFTIPQPAAVAERILSIPEALFGEPLSEKTYSAIKIYEYVPGKLDRGEPVVWLELLSPANKPGGRDAQEYFDKRLAILELGMVFIELDYLHESTSTLKGIPNYRARHGQMTEDAAHAYRLIVIDPRPNIPTGLLRLSEFDVDAPLPVVNIPLNGEDHLVMDFGLPYRKTFEETLYGLQLVDYAELPMNFDRYSAADQTRIVNRMIAVLDAANNGVDLETAPLPVHTLPLADALARLDALKTKAQD